MRLPRLHRCAFWALSIGVWIVFFAAREFFALERQVPLAIAGAALTLLAVGALAVARLHDRSRSGWWLATVLVPVAGALWLAWELALRRGSPNANAYGPGPRRR